MDKSKIKSFVIIVLLITNGFLLLLVGLDKAQDMRITGETERNIRAILAEAGIIAAPDIDFERGAGAVYTQKRSPESELRLVSAFIGEAAPEDIGGGITAYAGERGSASFYGTGYFRIELDSAPQLDPDDSRQVLAYLETAGIKGRPDDAGERGVVTVTPIAGTLPVYNASIRLLFDANGLSSLEGTRVLDELSEDSSERVISAPTAVMRFLDAVSESGSLCAELQGLELGAKLEMSFPGGGLVPVWRFATDAGDFFINAVTGKMEHFS